MNEPNFEAAPVESCPSPVPYKDRSAGLVVFGILTTLLGGLVGLLLLMTLFGLAAAQNAGVPTRVFDILYTVSFYGILAVGLVWLGIGSIMTQRWARALLLIFSWSWLVVGFFIMGLMAFILPKMTANLPALPPAFQVAMMLFLGVFFVIAPAVWIFFYSSRHVKATCEARDPVERWTDACPLPVLGFCLWLAVMLPMILVMSLSGRAVVPFFGVFVTGFPAALLCLVIAGAWGYAAWSLYKLEQRGWWVVLITLCPWAVSTIITFARHDVAEMYRLMSYSEAQINQMKQTGMMGSFVWIGVVSIVPFLGYLLFIKKYLRKN